MAYGSEQIENHISYEYYLRYGKHSLKSKKGMKLEHNRKCRRKLKANPESHPAYKEYHGWEW